MLIWGYNTNRADIAATATDTCKECGRVTPHSVRAEWQTAQLYVWIRSVRWERWYAKCSLCGEEHQLSPQIARAVRRMPHADPIPFWDRHGGEILGLAIVGAMAWGVLA